VHLLPPEAEISPKNQPQDSTPSKPEAETSPPGRRNQGDPEAKDDPERFRKPARKRFRRPTLKGDPEAVSEAETRAIPLLRFVDSNLPKGEPRETPTAPTGLSSKAPLPYLPRHETRARMA
jgi:hypothetical protein